MYPALSLCSRPGPLRGLLRYIANGDADDDLAADLAAAVTSANADVPWKEEALVIMTLEEDMRAQARIMQSEALERGLAEGREKGRAEGRAEGVSDFARLMAVLLDEGRVDDARRVAEDGAYRDKLMRELGIV